MRDIYRNNTWTRQECVCLSICTHAFMFDTWMFSYHWKTETSRISADTNGHVRVNGRVGPVTEQILQLLNECFSDDRCEQRRLRSFSNRVRVCLLGGPWNSFSTLGCMCVCRTITGLRQWRFCGTTIGGNAAAKKCVRSSPADEPHEKCEWKKRKLQGNGNIFLHIYCHDFGVLHFIHSLFISALSLLSCLPPSLLCSFFLSLLVQPAYLNWAGPDVLTGRGRGLACFQSITFWNLEIQVGPVSGRLYTLSRAGFQAHSTKSLSPLGILPDCFSRADCLESTTMADHTSPDYFSCSLCQNLLRDPVAIPCGHSFCMDCISGYWNEADYTGIYICPQCKITFTQRPVLRPNATLSMVAEKIKKSGLNLNLSTSQGSVFAGSNDVPCDFCIGKKLKAVKSCLNCLASYCEKHLKPHYESTTFKRHKLVDELGNLDRKICPQHQKSLELFCRTDQMCICAICTVSEHRGHDIVSAEAERGEKQVRITLSVCWCLLLTDKDQVSRRLRETASWMFSLIG